jgi:SAM-dependent methyltransferase
MSRFAACKKQVNETIHPSELMYAGHTRHYFLVGESALNCIEAALMAARKDPGEVKRVLDLPCGHGRVLRYLGAAFPAAQLTACDLLRDGVDFCAATFGAVPVYSCDDPENIPLRPGFDLIWVGSLFTHFAPPLWVRFLKVLESVLSPGGVLVFTTHGREALQSLENGDWRYRLGPPRDELLRQYYQGEFGYVRYAGSDSYYGMSLSTTGWVLDQIETHTALRVVSFSERAWDEHQDCFACVRDPNWQPPPRRSSCQEVVIPQTVGRSLLRRVRRLLRLG